MSTRYVLPVGVERMSEDKAPMVVVAAKVPPSVMAKLERLARESRRSKSQVIRLLIERALITDLDRPTLRGEA